MHNDYVRSKWATGGRLMSAIRAANLRLEALNPLAAAAHAERNAWAWNRGGR